MQIVILIAFVLVMSLRQVPGLAWPVALLGPAVALYVALAAALAALSTSVSAKAFFEPHPASTASRRRRGLLTAIVPLYLLAGLAALIYLGLGDLVSGNRVIQAVPLLPEVILLAPFVLAMLVTWWMDYPFHRMMRMQMARHMAVEGWLAPMWTLRQYISFNLRHTFLFIAVPVGLIILLNDLMLRAWPQIIGATHTLAARAHLPVLTENGAGILQVAMSLALSGLVFLISPALIVRIWQTSPMPAGELRDALLNTLRSLGLRCRQLLVWHSGGVIANAGVMGLIAPLRYVLMTDSLMERMDRRQVQAVFAHELGHIQQHHIFYSALFTLAAVGWVSLAAEALERAWPMNEYAMMAVQLVGLAAIWWLGFGYISRRFERQADVIAAWLAGQPYNTSGDADTIAGEGAAIFASALRRVAQLNNVGTYAPNWRHGTIDWRVQHILHLGATGGTRRDADRLARRIKRVLWLGTAACVALVIYLAW